MTLLLFNSILENSTSATKAEVRRPSLNEIKIVPDTPPQQEIPFDFNRFVEQMRRPSSKPITKYFKRYNTTPYTQLYNSYPNNSFLQAFDRRPWTVNEQIKIIQDFLDVGNPNQVTRFTYIFS